MEQATTGKAPPPIAINSGGGIQILNMNAVRGPAGIGANVVPPPGSAQAAAQVVGSPGPPGGGGGGGKGVGPRMISFSPQMLANATRPGQPVEESDSESVNQCDDDDNHELLKTTNAEPERSRSPSASNTGVSSSSDLQQQQHACDDNVTVVDDKCDEGELRKDDSIQLDDRNVIVNSKALDNHREENDRSTDGDNDLNLSNPAVDKSVTKVFNERSPQPPKSPSPNPPPMSSPKPVDPPNVTPPHPSDGVQSELDNEPMTCDDNTNHESGAVIGLNSDSKSISPPPSTRDIDKVEDSCDQEVDKNRSVISSIENNVSNDSNNKEVVSIDDQSISKDVNDVVKVGSENSNDKCIYEKVENDVPVLRNPVYTPQPEKENPKSDLGACSIINNNNYVESSSNQSCVQTDCEKSVSQTGDKCDSIDEKEEETLTSVVNSLDSELSASDDKCLSRTDSCGAIDEPPPLVHEDKNADMGIQGSKEIETVVVQSATPVDETTVDDVNLDMFSDSVVHDSGETIMTLHNPNGAIIQVERATLSEDSKMHASRREEGLNEDSRPKLMDMNLVDLIYMDCDEGIEVLGGGHCSSQPAAVTCANNGESNHNTWNTATRPPVPTATTHSTHMEHPYSPPKIINEIFTSTTPPAYRVSTITSGGPTNTYLQSSQQPLYWNKSKSNTPENYHGQQQRSPPSCAFQLHGLHGQQHHPQQGTLQVAARIPLRNDLNNSQRLSYPGPSSTRPHQSQPNPYSVGFNSSVMRDGSAGLPPQNISNPTSYPLNRANMNSSNVSSEYKANLSQHQNQQRCFTNDPQLYSQFLQYAKTFPLGQQENKQQEPATMIQSLPSTAAVARGQYVHAHSHPQQQQPNHIHHHPNKAQSIKPVVPFPHQSQPHQVNSLRQPTAVLQQQPPQQQRQYTPVIPQQQHYSHQQITQSTPLQSQYRSNSINTNGCDNTNKMGYHAQAANPNPAVNFHQGVAPGVTARPYFPPSSHHNPSTPLSQSQNRQHHPQNPSAMPKESSSCSYTNLSGAVGQRPPVGNQPAMYNPAQINHLNLHGNPGPNSTGSQPNSYPQSNYAGYSNTTLPGSNNTRMPYPHQQQPQRYPPSVRPPANMPQSSQISGNNNKAVGDPPPSSSTASNVPTVPSGWNPPLLQGARAQLLQVLRPGAFSNQNLGVRGEVIRQPPATQQTSHHQTPNRLPYQGTLPQPIPQQQLHFRGQTSAQQGQQASVLVPPHQPQQRLASVIAPRYSGGNPISHHIMPGGSSDNQQKHPPTSISMSTLPSPQMLRNSQYVAHNFMPTSTTSSAHGSSISSGAYNQSSVIRPNHYTSSTGNTVVTTTTKSNISSNTYYSNQASVIRAPPCSSSSSSSANSLSNACTINRNTSNSSIVIERGGAHSNTGYHHQSSTSSSSGGYNPGELTLQSFLSNPSAPFMCPSSSPSPTPATTTSSTSPLAGERSTSVGSGYHYNNSSENWGGASYHARGDNQDETYPSLSSCQYNDGAMRRYNAPITLQSLQALSGLPPGANHLLVKTENGQFQLVSVRMQSPTAAAAAPGTPVVPSTVAAPPTSMSIAQQLPSNSPLVAPPLPSSPHPAPPQGGPPSSLVPPPPISSSMITTTTIPPHQSAQQGRIITSSSSNHFVTSWSSSNNNSLVNNNSTSSPLPVISSSAAHPPQPHPPHLGPPPPSAPPHHAPSLPLPPPPSVPSSVIMPPSLSSASNSQLLKSTANSNISSSSTSSSNLPTAVQAAISATIENYNRQMAASSAQQQQQHGSVMGPPGGSRQPPPPPSNSIPVAPAAGPMSNSLPPGASVIRTSGSLGPSSLPPPPPPVVVSTSSNAAVAAVANSVISSSTNPSNSNLPAAPTSPASFRPQLQQSNTASPLPNNNATNNAQSGSMGMGMMTASSNSILSVQHPNHHHHHHQTPPPYNSQLHPHLQPPQQAPPSAYHTSYTSNSIASSNSTNTTANTVSQMSNETAKTKCKNFLSFLLELSAKQNQTVARNVKNLIQGLIDGKVNEENFADRLQKEVNSQPQPCLVGFLKKSLPHLRHSLAVNELKIEGIKPPPLAALVPPAPVSALVPQTPPTPPEPTRKKPSKQASSVRPTTPSVPASPVRIITPPVNSASPSSTPTPTVSASSSGTPAPPTASPSPSSAKSSKPSKGSSSKSKSNSSSNSSSAAGASASSGPGGTPSSKSTIPSTSKSSKEKEKKEKPFSSSAYGGDDDINDVAAMGGVNLAEESQRILGSTEYVGTQIRSCRDETLIQASPISAKFKVIAARYGLEETPSAEVSALLSHAVEERLKTMIEKLSVIAEHRMDVIKLDERYEITQDVKGQLRFLEELDKLEKKRHDEQEREMLIRAAKSRSKSEDPEQAKLKAKAKEMQRVALEEMRQRDANLTALQAIGPRKKPKLDIAGGSHGSAVPSPMGATGASSSLGRPQMPLRPRLKRVNLRDLLFLLEHDKETMRSPFLYKNLLLK